MSKIVEKVESLIYPIFNENKYELVDVQYVKEGPEWYLRIFIDKIGGVTLDDCEFISREISLLLDNDDFIESAYLLEVSSPGVERPIKEKDYNRFIGKKVQIKTYTPIDNKKKFIGILKDYNEGFVIIESEDATYKVPANAIASANLSVDF